MSPTKSPLCPLSERILALVGGSRHLWVGVWALVPWANAGANLLLGTDRTSAVWEQSTTLVVLNYTSVSLAVLLSLWGARTIARRLETLREPTSIILVGEAP